MFGIKDKPGLQMPPGIPVGASIWLCCVLCLLGAGSSRAEVVPGDDFSANTAKSAQVLQQWYNQRGLWDTTDWWNAANCVEAIEDAIVANNGQAYLPVLSHTFERNATNNFLNEYYDDEGWWALAWIRAFDLTGDPRYLAMAKTIFADMKGGWDNRCGGGIWWKKDRRYKNAVANELFLLVAIRLHQRTPGDEGRGSYLDWAQREWAWFKQSGMINAQNLVNDGLNRYCENNGKTTWTYNQGVILGGLTELYRVTGDTNCLNQAMAIADAAITTLVSTNGILREPCEPDSCGGADVPQFKGIFIRYLAQLYGVTRKPTYGDFLFRNAHSVWFNNRDDRDRFGLRWTGPIDSVDAARHSSAMMAISAMADPVTTNLPFARGAGSAAFNHEVGVVTGTQAWMCSAANTTRPGFMLSGACLASLATGTHTVHFRMAVNALSNSNVALVRLDVRENNGGSILAMRDIQWSGFSETNGALDFSLTFTNPAAWNPLEFRVYWNHANGAPALTLTDMTIDGAHNWTAANLKHDLGRLDGHNAWVADPVQDRVSGFLAKGPGTTELQARPHVALFELKVDNFNWDNASVAELSVVETTTGAEIAKRELKRNEFPNTLYHAMAVPFRAGAGKRYEFRTFWHFGAHAPRLSQRSVIVKPVE